MRMIVAGPGEKWATSLGNLTVEDYEIKKWPSGKIYTRYLLEDLLGELAADMHRNIKANFDNFVVIEGAEGSGKSNLAYQVCKTFDPSFTMDNYVYDTEAFKQRLKEGDVAGQTFWMDEGSNIANNRDWQSTGNKDLVLFLETMRSKGITFVLCIPTHERLDVYIREHRIRYLIKCMPMKFQGEGYKPRGYFELRKKTDYGRLSVVGYGKFDPMPPEIKSEYEAIKVASQDAMIKEMVDPDDAPGKKYKRMYEESCKKLDSAMLAMYNSGTDAEHLMDLFGIESKKTFFNRISKARKAEGGGD